MKIIQIFLLILIIVGLGLIATQRLWVPGLVERILEFEGTDVEEPLTEEGAEEEPIEPMEPTMPVGSEPGGCFVGGCSSQVCSDSPDVITTCEWREEYACYAAARCERQPTGECGWTETEELRACLAGEVL